MTTTRELTAGDRVVGGYGADRDTGTIDHIDGRMAVVRWDSGVVTPCPLSLLQRQDAE